MPLLSPSGGLVYHLRALRFGRSLWAPFRSALAAWIEAALPLEQELILVGPSGGHCLPLAALRRARSVLALEPDLLARVLLARRLSLTDLRFESRDLLLAPLLQGRPGLDLLLQRRPHANVLFCNVLGQVQLDLTDAEQERFTREFQARLWPELQTRSWLSFHDYWSLKGSHLAGFPSHVRFDAQPSDEALGQACFGERGSPVTVLDHGTASLFPNALARHYFGWQLTPGAFHLIEGVTSGARPHALGR